LPRRECVTPCRARVSDLKQRKLRGRNHSCRSAIAPIRSDHLALAAYLNAHFEWMAVTGYSEDTIRARRTALRRFIAWCEERALRDPKDITKPILERYQRHLFYYRKEWPADDLGHPVRLSCALEDVLQVAREGKSHPLQPGLRDRVAEAPEASAARDPVDPGGRGDLARGRADERLRVRDRAMLETLYSTALRRMELPALALYDVDLTRRLVMVREGKGKRDRVVPIGERAAAWVEKYLQEARPQLLVGDAEALFLTDYGEPMTPEYVAERVRRYMHFAGIKKPGACHLFRHACATHMLENGADTRFIQALLGHADLGTTQIYTRVSIDKLR
jgi:integrase/recombinase XerD